MSTTTTFEDEVRAMLARRAADVPEVGAHATVPLPTGLRIPVVAERRWPGRPRLLAVAAAVVVLVGLAGGFVLRSEGDGRERTGPADDPTTTAPRPRPEHLRGLPEGIDPTVGPLAGIGWAAPTPDEAMAAVLEPTFGDELVPAMPFDWLEPQPDDLWAAVWSPTGPVDPAVWGAATLDAAPIGGGGTVTARRSAAGWAVVAVTSAAVDLTGVRYDGARLTGEVRTVVDTAPLRVVVSTMAGEELATSDLTTTEADRASEPGVLPLFDLTVDSGGEPVVLWVEAGDRPGQIGFDGVGVAALSAVALPAPADPVVDAGTGSTVPTAGPVEPFWPLPGQPLDRSEQADVARALLARATGTDVEVDSIETSPTGVTATLTVVVDRSPDLEVGLARDATGWAVHTVGGGGVTVEDGRLVADFGRLGGRSATVDFTVARDGPLGPSIGYHEVDPEPDGAYAAVAVAYDAEGQVVGVTGNAL